MELLAFPKPVLVAIGVRGDEFLAFAEKDAGFRSVSRLQEAEGSPAAGFEIDPFDVMVGIHRVEDASHGCGNFIPVPRDDRDVLFGRGFGDAWLDLHHGFAAAPGGFAHGVDLSNDRTAGEATIEFHICCLLYLLSL